MSELTIVRERKLPEWQTTDKGEYRLSGGRWSLQRVAEFLISNPTWQTVDDLARVVYQTNTKSNRKKVRSRISKQRNFMRDSLEQPFVTMYGSNGQIMKIKLFNKIDENDRAMLRIELDKARDQKELSENRYESLLNIFLLPERLSSESNAA